MNRNLLLDRRACLKGGGALKTGRFLPNIKGNQGDLLTTLLACAGVPLDRPIGNATKQIKEML
jgi:hypothetical protein